VLEPELEQYGKGSRQSRGVSNNIYQITVFTPLGMCRIEVRLLYAKQTHDASPHDVAG
jgi:hypothetical protein